MCECVTQRSGPYHYRNDVIRSCVGHIRYVPTSHALEMRIPIQALLLTFPLKYSFSGAPHSLKFSRVSIFNLPIQSLSSLLSISVPLNRSPALSHFPANQAFNFPAMDVRLTEGAILKMNTEDLEEDYKPVLQVRNLKQIHTQRGGATVQDTERYKLVMSDGSHSQPGMLGTQQNFLVQQGLLQEGSIVCLNQFTCTTVQKRKYVKTMLDSFFHPFRNSMLLVKLY